MKVSFTLKRKTAVMAVGILFFVSFICVFAFAFGFSQSPNHEEKAGKSKNTGVIFQSSTVTALFERLYSGNITVDELRRYGGLGVGTYNDFDGELVAVDGEFYKIDAADGKAYRMPGDAKTPFAIVTHFKADATHTIEKSMNYSELLRYLDSLLPSAKIFYAFKINVHFTHVKTRSVFPQKKPYPDLREIMNKQAIFEYKDIAGYLVGFRYPSHTRCINSPGYHFHFISKDKNKGGHVLVCQTSMKPMKIQIHNISRIQMALPY
jgi:acetolactate decarboxylase